MLLDRKIWSVASGKGGSGKSMLAASMAVHLAELGFKVMLVDADLGCANLHTFFGVNRPRVTLSDFIDRKVEHVEEAALDTEIPKLRLICGARDPMKASHIRYQQKRRIIRQLNTLVEDIVIIDLATGGGLTQVELFLASDLGAMIVLPEPTAIENFYSLYRMIFFHRVREIPGWKKFESNLPANLMDGSTPPVHFLHEVANISPKWARSITNRMDGIVPGITINMARTKEDRDLGPALSLVCKRYFGLKTPFLGAIEYDECVIEATRSRKPVILDYPHSRPSRSIRQLTETMLSLSRRPT